MINLKQLSLLAIIGFLMFISSEPSYGGQIDTPSIIDGNAKIIGRINYQNRSDNDSIMVTVVVPLPISGGTGKYQALADRSGRFVISVDIETTFTLAMLLTSLNPEKPLMVKLANGESIDIDLTYDSHLNIENITTIPAAHQNDMTQGFDLINRMIDHRGNGPFESLYNKSTDYFLNYAKTILSERLSIADKDTVISKELKSILSKDFSLFLYNTHVLPYEEEMNANFRNVTKDKSGKANIKIDRSYFRFLKDFNLNDPEYLEGFIFPEFQKALLQHETLALPEIGEMDVPSWLTSVKAIMSNLIGFDSGPYYDILAANAYGRQLNEETRPLSAKQKQNIARYWKEGQIAKILLKKNTQVVELAKFKTVAKVNDVVSIPQDKVIETILAKHKGKVVFIDLWATWCAPCLDAMQDFKTTKTEFHNKNVAFVYLTNDSSPKKLWEEKIKGIGNEHYYLQDNQWEHISDEFDIQGLPTYLLYNKDGVLINKFTAFPGSEKVKNMINALL